MCVFYCPIAALRGNYVYICAVHVAVRYFILDVIITVMRNVIPLGRGRTRCSWAALIHHPIGDPAHRHNP